MSDKVHIQEKTITIPLAEYEQLKAALADTQAQLAELKRMIFGRKSERFIASDDSQTSLFEVQKSEVEPDQSSTSQSISFERKVNPKNKKKPVRMPLPAHLPRQEEIIEPDNLAEGMKKIGEEVTEILEHIPGKLYVRKIIRPKYVKSKADGVHIGTLPSLPIPKGNAGPGLLAHIMVSKFVDHLPYYRQIQMFKREGVTLSDTTFNGWFNATARLLEPLYDALKGLIQQQIYLQADESPIKVQDSHKQGATHLGYHWVYHSPPLKLAIFTYQPSRSGDGPKDFLLNFQGYLQTDGYAAYDQIGEQEGVTLLACMAHVRRYFEKALDNDRKRAQHALTVIQSLYLLEREVGQDHQIDLLTIRQEKALPILQDWKQWLDENRSQTLPKSKIGKAINYTLNHWSRLIRYTQQDKLHIDNNAIENTIRPLAIGRKNYLFAGSHEAAQKAAMCYSFFACCKLQQINPYQWLKEVLTVIQDQPVNSLDKMLPHKWKPLTQHPQD